MKWIIDSQKMRMIAIIFVDILCVAVSAFLAIWIRYDFTYTHIPSGYMHTLLLFLLFLEIATIECYYMFRLYHSIWRYASITEAYRIILTYLLLAVVYIILYFIFKLPRSVMFITYILCGISCVFVRFGYRLLRFRSLQGNTSENSENILIIGGGQAAREIISDIRLGNHPEYNIMAVIDDNPIKWGRDLEGYRIFGGRDKIQEAVERYNIKRIIFAITNISPQNRADILNICKETGCKIQAVPGLFDLYSGKVRISSLRDVQIQDLLGREEIRVDTTSIMKSLAGKVVMVTGGGGSIGSELCRQIANADVKKLIIFDIYENTTYDIQLELKRKHPNMNLETLIGDVTDKNRMDHVLEEHKPDIIFHAAAHKHVPLMEDSPNEAIKNNVMGTYTVAKAAAEHGVSRFLLISTDKAVNPTNIMGASKRLCEMVVQMCQRTYPDTTYMAVRFGNVLGSNGSVIPLFKKQIAEGGPVTVTDKNIIRYFMTIPEAVSLVLQAEFYAKGGEIFVLDMGKPVKIDDMARNLIKLSGFKPDIDIPIVYTGLRPGEKMYEELLMDEEGLQKTQNSLIFIGKPIEMDDEKFKTDLQLLKTAAYSESENIEEIVASVVDTYHPEHASK